MNTLEIILSVFQNLHFTTIAIVLSLFSLILSLRLDIFSRKTKYDENRPRVRLESITLDPNKAKFYVGDSVKKELIGDTEEDFTNSQILPIDDITKEEADIINKSVRKNTTFHCKTNNKDYLLLNACSEINFKTLIFALDVLNVELSFDNDRFSHVTITKCFSISPKRFNFCRNMSIDSRFEIRGKKFNVPIAYVADNDLNIISLIFAEICKLIISKDKKMIDFLHERKKAGKYIAFGLTAYLFEMETVDNEKYYYTLLLEVEENGVLTKSRLQSGDKLFYEMAKEASRRTKEKIEDIIISSTIEKEPLMTRIKQKIRLM